MLSALFVEVMPLNDVLLYGWWLQLMQQGQPIFGIGQPFVYPYPSLLPMWLAQFLGGPAGILVGWTTLVALLNVAAVGFLTGWSKGSRSGYLAAWFWIAFLVLLGPVGIGRIDSISVGLAIIGVVCFANQRLFSAMVLFTFGAWLKIWPVALGIAALISQKSRKAMGYAAAVTVSVVFLVAFFLGADSSVLSFVFTQGSRGIQIEAPIATPWLWAAKFGLGNAGIYFDKEIITNQVSGDLVQLVSPLMTAAMAIAMAITVWLGVRAFKNGSPRNQIFVTVALTAVLDLIVFNKVGSPQFMTWLAVPVIAWIYLNQQGRWFAIGVVLTVALLTNLVYPILYLDLMALGNLSISVLTIRNLLLIVLLIWANVQLGNLGKGSKSQAVAESSVQA